jgi:YidC/Oxa1 family membrane protein insertase
MDFIINPFVNALLWIYQILGAGTNDFGWAIIIFTVLIRLVISPLTKSQLESSKKMQEMQESPEWQKIQKKYKDDKEKLSQEQMRLYQEMGVNPFSSCLPTLIQFPLIIALYWSITKSLAISPVQLLTLKPIIALPDAASLIPLNNQFLWMDLSQPERWLGLTNIIPESWPIIGGGIPILAILVFITSYFQTKLTATSTSSGNQTAMMSNMMSIYIPVLMAWLSYSYSAGLAIYFVASNLASLVQYALMGRLDFSKLFGKKEAAPEKGKK